MYKNKVKIELESKSLNEGFARVAIASFVAQLDPTLEELTDVKTAVSEAVTNSIIHGYLGKEDQIIVIEAAINDRTVDISVIDYGNGIENVKQAMEPLFTSRPDLERSGMGFTVMESFMDKVSVESVKGEGTRVYMSKTFK